MGVLIYFFDQDIIKEIKYNTYIMNRPFVFSIFLIIIALLILHLTALSNFWYWKYWWFDNLLHFLGGFSISLIAIFYGHRFGHIKISGRSFFLFIGVFVSFVAAILWEIFEYKAGLVFSTQSYPFDTFLDVLMGLMGSLCGVLYSFLMLKNEQ